MGHIFICKDDNLYNLLEAIVDSNLGIAKSNKLIADAINNVAEVLKSKQEHSCEQIMEDIALKIEKSLFSKNISKNDNLISENIGSFQNRTHKPSYDINSPQC